MRKASFFIVLSFFSILQVQLSSAEIYDNRQYRFQLSTPNSDWKVLNKKMPNSNTVLMLVNVNVMAFVTVDIDEGINIRDKIELDRYLTKRMNEVKNDVQIHAGEFQLLDKRIIEKDEKMIGILDFRTTIPGEDFRRRIYFYLKDHATLGVHIYRLETAAPWDYYDKANDQFEQIVNSFVLQ